MPSILSANTLSSGGYDVDNSCKFNGDAYVHKAVVGGNQRTFTYSFWTKRSTLNNYDTFIGYAGTAGGGGGTNRGELIFVGDGDDTLRVGFNPGGSSWSNYTMNTGVFRDTSAWYNIVLKVNTTSGTEAERLKIFVNGVSQGLSGYPSQNFDTGFNVNGYVYHIGRSASGTGNFIKGYLAEAVFIDGTALDADSFGEFDSDSGIWKPIDVSGLTFGNNGFHLDFEDSANLGNDANGGTDFTEVSLAATDQSTDTCTNNFATLNPLDAGSNYTFSEGNLQFAQSATNWDSAYSSIGVTKGKWYMEFKGKVGAYYDVGVTDVITPTTNPSVSTGGVAWKSNSEFAQGGNVGGGLPSNVTSPASNTYTADDIIGIALDVDNETVYFAKNGTYEVNSDPTSGASKTGGTDLPNSDSTYFFQFAAYKGSAASGTAQVNFGGGSVDAISSGNTDADGHGNFEHAPPSGYFALCTKNLAEYG